MKLFRSVLTPLTHIGDVPVRFSKHIPAFIERLEVGVMRVDRIREGVAWNFEGCVWMNECYRNPLVAITEESI